MGIGKKQEMIEGFVTPVYKSIISKYSSIPAKIWFFCTSIRVFIATQVIGDAYGDEDSFVCDAVDKKLAPGCYNQCYMHYAPVSLASFWIISLMILLLPSLLFKWFIGWTQNNAKFREEFGKSQTWLSKTRLKYRKSEEIHWSTPIAYFLTLQLIATLVIEFTIVRVFFELQCLKFNVSPQKFASENTDKVCSVLAMMSQSKYWTIPEAYRCNPNKFWEKTWFGVDRSKKYNLCNTVGFKGSTCWIPSAPQKTYLNQTLIWFTLASAVFMLAELILVFSKMIWKKSTKALENRKSKPNSSCDFNFSENQFLRDNNNVDEPALY